MVLHTFCFYKNIKDIILTYFLLEGDFEHGLLSGKGLRIYGNDDKYYGEYDSNERHGHGVLLWSDGTRLEVTPNAPCPVVS